MLRVNIYHVLIEITIKLDIILNFIIYEHVPLVKCREFTKHIQLLIYICIFI